MEGRIILNVYFASELIKKSGVEDKFTLTRLVIKKMRQLVKEKDKKALLEHKDLTTYVLEELQEDKEKPQEPVPKENKSQ